MSDATNGQVLGRAFETLARKPVAFGLLALLMIAVPNFLSQFYTRNAELTVFQLGTLDADTVSFLLTLLDVPFKAIVMGAIIAAGDAGIPDLGVGAQITLKKIFPLIAVSLLSWIAIGIGLILLIIPGVVVYCMLSVAGAAMLGEGSKVIESLRRSRALTDGSKGMIFVLFFLFAILQAVAGFIVTMIATLVGSAGQDAFVQAAGSALLAAAVALVGAAVTAALYLELRIAREGGLNEDLVTVFA